MSDTFEQPKKPTLFRSFESDVARVLRVEKEEAEDAIAQKKNEYTQKQTYIKKVGSKRLFYLVGGTLMLVVAGGASAYLYYSYTNTHTGEGMPTEARVSIEVSQDAMQTIIPLIQEKLAQENNGIVTLALVKNGAPLSFSEMYALLPTKKVSQKADGLETFLYGARKQDSHIDPFIIVKETAPLVPQLPLAYDDTVYTVGVNLLDLSDEAKVLLAEERFIQTYIENIPVRSIVVSTEDGQEGIVITRLPEPGTLLISTKKALQNGILDSLSVAPIVLSL